MKLRYKVPLAPLITAFFLAALSGSYGEDVALKWERSLESALARSAVDRKPVFVFWDTRGDKGQSLPLFQQPLINESLGSDFVPLLIDKSSEHYGALGGAEDWVGGVQFLHGAGADLKATRDAGGDLAALVGDMISAIEVVDRRSLVLPLLKPETLKTRRIAFSQG